MDWQSLVEECSGFSVSQEEVTEYMPDAKRKLNGIIDHEGDADGTRNEACYLAMLLGGIILVERLSKLMIK